MQPLIQKPLTGRATGPMPGAGFSREVSTTRPRTPLIDLIRQISLTHTAAGSDIGSAASLDTYGSCALPTSTPSHSAVTLSRQVKPSWCKSRS